MIVKIRALLFVGSHLASLKLRLLGADWPFAGNLTAGDLLVWAYPRFRI